MALENFRLKVFRTVAEKHSFRMAAEALLLTQPAVTLQIKALEQELGVQLFDRTGSTIALTGAGRVLHKYAERLHALSREAEHELGIVTGEQHGELSIAASTTVAQYVLPKLLGEFLQHNPRVRPTIVSGNTDLVVQRVSDSTADIGVVEGPAMRHDLKIEPFIEDELMLVVPPRHEFAERPRVKAAELEPQRLILREKGSGTRRIVERSLRQAGLSPKRLNIAMELDSTEAIKLAIEAGLGIGFVPVRGTHNELKLGTLREIPIEGISLQRHFSIVYRRRPEPARLALAFLEFLREVRDRARPSRTL